MLNRRPRGSLCWVICYILSATSQVPKLHRGSRGPPRPGVAFPTTFRLQLAWNSNSTGTRTAFCSIRRPYIAFKLPRGDIDTPPRLRNFFRYLAIGMCHFCYFWNGLCDRHRAEITVMQFTGHSLPLHHSEVGPSPCPILSAEQTCAISFDYWPLGCVTSFRCITLE